MQLKNVASGTFRKSVNNVKSAASTYFAIVLPPQRERLGRASGILSFIFLIRWA